MNFARFSLVHNACGVHFLLVSSISRFFKDHNFNQNVALCHVAVLGGMVL